MRMAVSLGLLSSAFAPLIAFLAVFTLDTGSWLLWAVVACCAISVSHLAMVMRRAAWLQRATLDAQEVKRADDKLLSFFTGYVMAITVAAFAGGGPLAFAQTLALVVFLAVVYHRGEMYYLNPTLALAGFRIFDVVESNGTSTWLLSRESYLKQAEPIEARRLARHVAIQLPGDDRAARITEAHT